MIPTPLDGLAGAARDIGYHLERVPAAEVPHVMAWMLAGAWTDTADRETLIPVAERLLWARWWAHETWVARGGRAL